MIRPTVARRSLLEASTVLAWMLLVSVSGVKGNEGEGKGPMMAYVGTFTLHEKLPSQPDMQPRDGRGIHLFTVDRRTGALTPSGVFDHGASPSYLAVNAEGTRLYSANETAKMDDGVSGSISSFSIDQSNGQLTSLNTVSSGGAGPTYVSIHPSGRFLFVANYFGGNMAVLPILPDGTLGPATDIKRDPYAMELSMVIKREALGTFSVSNEHDASNVHTIKPDPSGRFVVSSSMNQTLAWRFDERKGVLSQEPTAKLSISSGDGTRHFDFHPNGRWFYSINDIAGTVGFWEYEAANGRLSALCQLSALPGRFQNGNITKEIMVSRGFVYVAARTIDGVARFAPREDGSLKLTGEGKTGGGFPRSVFFEPGGNYLYSCNQKAGNITTFHVDEETGGPRPIRPGHPRGKSFDDHFRRAREARVNEESRSPA